MDFLHDSSNKTTLFISYLNGCSIQFPTREGCTHHIGSVCHLFRPLQYSMPNCNHEGADTRIVVHLLHSLEHGMKTIKVRTGDSDVTILVGDFFDLISIQLSADI